MPSFATVVSRIRDDLNRGAAYDERIKRAILSAVQFYRAKRFAFNQLRTASGINPGQEFSSYGASYVQIDSVRMDDGGGGYFPLRKTNWGEIEALSTSPNDTGQPVVYAIQNRSMRFYPIPDRTCSYETTFLADLWNQFRYPSDISDSYSGPWLTEAEELIRLHAMVDILQVYRQSDEDDKKSDRLSAREQVVYRELRVRASEEVASGEIQPFM